MVDISKYDRIVLNSRKEVDVLLAWRDEHKDLVRQFNPALNEGVIIYEDNYVQYFRVEGTSVHMRVYVNEKQVLAFTWHHHTTSVSNVTYVNVMDYPENKAIEDALTTWASLMAYMVHNKENREVVKKSETSSTITKKPKKGKKGSNKVVRLTRVVYNVTIDKDINRTKRKYDRQVEAWNVKGHWRQYKSGKRIWINQTTKGKGRANPTTYKI